MLRRIILRGSRAKVYFSKNINADTLIKLYDMINEGIYGKVAIKLHTGEPHGPNILPREMVKAFQAHVPNSNIVETNALYEGGRVRRRARYYRKAPRYHRP